MPLHGLTDDDVKLIQQLLDESGKRWFSTTGRGAEGSIDHQEIQAPEVYVARVPSTGIPALIEEPGTGPGQLNDNPGSALCDIHRVVYTAAPVGTANDGMMVSVGSKRRVWNLGIISIQGNQWIIALRDKFGYWFASPAGGEIDVLKTTPQKSGCACTEGAVATDEKGVDQLEFNGCDFKVTVSETGGKRKANIGTAGGTQQFVINFLDANCVSRTFTICFIHGLFDSGSVV